MVAATALAIFFIPMFYKVITARKLREKRSTDEIRAEAQHAQGAAHHGVHHPGHHGPAGSAEGEPA